MTITETIGELCVVRCWCGIQHAVPRSLRDEQQRQHDDRGANGGSVMGIHCPLGHSHVPAGETRAQRLEKQLAARGAELDRVNAALRHKREEVERKQAEVDRAERRRRAEKGAKTRLKKRVAAGTCPCCEALFPNLQEHMAHAHPEFVAAAEGEHDEPEGEAPAASEEEKAADGS